MSGWVNARGGLLNEHLPPLEASPLLTRYRRNKVRARRRIETPTDELGLVDLDALFGLVAEHVDPDYQWPQLTNVHHIYYPRRLYHSDPLARAFRESNSNQCCLSVQIHNYVHACFTVPHQPARDVMHERVAEQAIHDDLFRLGRYALRFERLSQLVLLTRAEVGKLAVRESLKLSRLYAVKADEYSDMYHERLEQVPDEGGLTGLLPPRSEVVDMHSAVPNLGQASAQGYIDIRRATQERRSLARLA